MAPSPLETRPSTHQVRYNRFFKPLLWTFTIFHVRHRDQRQDSLLLDIQCSHLGWDSRYKQFYQKKIECSPYYSGYCGNLLLHLDNADGAEEAEEKAQERASEEQTRAETSAKR